MRHVVTVLLVLCAVPARADLIFYEPFNYTVGDGLSGVDGNAYTASGGKVAANGAAWQPTGYASLSANYDKTNDSVLVSNNLSVSGLAASTGNAIAYGNAGYTARVDFRTVPADTTKDIKPTGGVSTVVYYSLALQVTSLDGFTAANGILAGFNNSVGQQSANPGVIAGRLNIKSDGAGGFNLGLSKASDGTALYDSTSLALNQTQFVVVKYQFAAAGGQDDSATIWVNPNPSTFGGADPVTGFITNSAGNDVTSDVIRSFIFRQGNTGTTLVPGVIADELRIGTTYADVTPTAVVVPEIGAFWLLLTSCGVVVGLNGMARPLAGQAMSLYRRRRVGKH